MKKNYTNSLVRTAYLWPPTMKRKIAPATIKTAVENLERRKFASDKIK